MALIVATAAHTLALAILATSGAMSPGPPGAGAQPDPASHDPETIAVAAIVRARPDLIALRHDLHRHPEISGNEERTAAVVAKRLEELGLEVRTGIGGHGVTGLLEGGLPGKRIAYRADMDAMPSFEPDPVEYRSVIEGVRHICGHDVHTAIGLAIAEGLASVRERLAGSVLFVFQPAEETASGARAMLADGVFEPEAPSAIFGLHAAPLPVGQLATRSGVMMPGRDRVRVRVSGTADPAVLDAAAANARDLLAGVATLEPRQATQPMPPSGFALVFVGAPEVDGEARMVAATMTIADDATREQIRSRLEPVIEALNTPDVSVTLEIENRWIAGVDNDAELTERASTSVRRVLGADSVVELQTVVPAFSEDFGSFQQRSPGAFFFLGVSNPERGWVGMPHTADFIADDEAIFVGARAMITALVDELRADP